MRTFLTSIIAILWLIQPLFSQSWIRVNQIGYLPVSVKVAVCISTEQDPGDSFNVCDALSSRIVFTGTVEKYSGADWGMKSAARLDFSELETPGGYYITMNDTKSEPFRIAADVYQGTADYILRYMRQQRCGYNPYYADSCHTHDGFIVDHPTRSGEIIDVVGGWHDASDYLQYVATSANAVYQMLFAYSKNPHIFGDLFDASGDPGSNGIPDILDEAKWGIDWLVKMNPDSGIMFNQLADDRDHRGFRLPTRDSVSYGYGLYRPVYFITGKSQGLARYKNRTTGVSSTAGKYASTFAFGSEILKEYYPELSAKIALKAQDAWEFALTDMGNTQTACNVSPYFYEEDNWVDDMELAAWSLFSLTGDSSWLVHADYWGTLEPVTQWIEKDTARHYQFYPFINLGHAWMAESGTFYSPKYIAFMRKGLILMEERRKSDPFRVKIPFIWCSNNYVAAALTQHMLYAETTGDTRFSETEAALRDWLFGCNPWGTSMISGLPAGGDYPLYPHAALTSILGEIPEGGLIDGPVYARIYNNLIGISLFRPDEYELFQNGKVVYHDDMGDYSTNEPTMDGTASLSFVLSALEAEGLRQGSKETDIIRDRHGAIIRLKTDKKVIYLTFSADEYGDGFNHILKTLKKNNAGGSFFLTGNFLRNKSFSGIIKKIIADGHYIGPHSDKHLLYASWENRDSLLVEKEEFMSDLRTNYEELFKTGYESVENKYFLAPYEWYNDVISSWTSDMGATLINFTPGTGTNADYTTPDMPSYRSSDELMKALKDFEISDTNRLNGAIILIHPGTHPDRKDKFYMKLEDIIDYFSSKGYTFEHL